MTQTEAINKVLAIAKNEVGYLEKASNAQLDDKTANAGSANYTKYWRDIAPEYQGQPWCADYITWLFVKAFGKAMAAKLLRHYPYISCVAISKLFTLNANPQVGDIVIFKRNGTFTHTGIVTSVNGDYFTTNEGNTSSGSEIVANGGAVCEKGYYNSNLPGTKFCTPEWSLLAGKSNDEEVNTVAEFKDISGHYAKQHIEELHKMGVVNGDNNGNFNPNEPVTRADAAIMVRNAIRYITGK